MSEKGRAMYDGFYIQDTNWAGRTLPLDDPGFEGLVYGKG